MMLYDTIILFCKITDNIKDLGVLDNIILQLTLSEERIRVRIVQCFWDHQIHFYLTLDIFLLDILYLFFDTCYLSLCIKTCYI